MHFRTSASSLILMPTKTNKARAVSVAVTLLWLAMFFFQFKLGRATSGALPWALWAAGTLETLIVAIPVISLIVDAQVRGRGPWPPVSLAAAWGKLLALALAVNHLDAVLALLRSHQLHGVSGALQLTRVWLLATILPAVIQAGMMLWIVANRSTIWRLRHVGSVVLGSAVTYVLCIIDGPVQPLDWWSPEIGQIWVILMCRVVPLFALLAAALLWLASLSVERSSGEKAQAE